MVNGIMSKQPPVANRKCVLGPAILSHQLSHLVRVNIQSYAMLQLFNVYVIFHQAQSFMSYNIRTTY